VLFAYRLALELGVPNPIQMLEELPARVFLQWQTYAALEPWRFADEPARTRALPSAAQVIEKAQAMARALFALKGKG
jgi:hypothetical protein